jgi:predicted RecA/RadA family phage recombinase
MASYVSPGVSIDYTPGSAVAAGEMVSVGEHLTGVATRPIPADTLGSLTVEGIFDCEKKTGSGTDWDLGTVVYLDASEGHVTDAEGDGDSLAGVTVEATTTSATTVKVKLAGVGPQGPAGS